MSGLPHSVAFDGHLSQRNTHQRVLLLGLMEGKWFIDDAKNISLSVQYVKMITLPIRFVYGTYNFFFLLHSRC